MFCASPVSFFGQVSRDLTNPRVKEDKNQFMRQLQAACPTGFNFSDIDNETWDYWYKMAHKKTECLEGGVTSRLWEQTRGLGRHLQMHLSSYVPAYDVACSAGWNLYGFVERLALLPSMQESYDKSLLKQYSEDERIFSALADREPPCGTLFETGFPNPGTWKIVFSKETSGGYVYIAVSANQKESQQAIIALRGTALRWRSSGHFRSLLNNLLPQMGTWACQNLWPQIHACLMEHNIQTIHIGGKSLGGVLAQILAVYLRGAGYEVQRLVTMYSPGVDLQAHNIFKNQLALIRSGDTHTLLIDDYRYSLITGYAQDLTPLVGGHHLACSSQGGNVIAKKIYVTNLGSEPPHLAAFENQRSFIRLCLGLLGAHQLRLGLYPQQVQIYTRQFTPLPEKGSLPYLEKVRRLVAYIFQILTLGFIPCMLRIKSITRFFEAHVRGAKSTKDNEHLPV